MLVHSFCVLLFFLFSLNLNIAEWVFVNEKKIYRSPMQHDQLYKIKRDDGVNNNFSENPRNESQTFRHLVNAIRATSCKNMERMNFTSESTTVSDLSSAQTVKVFTTTSDNHIPTSTNIENKFVRFNTIAPTKDTIFKTLLTTQLPDSNTMHRRETLPQDKYYNYTSKQYDGILQYLPMDILKNVHRILQSQPVSFEGKIRFLQAFEKTLMSEIESRLAIAVMPSRRTRGADYHGHGYDDHDDHHVGFPSIEGALMAISFLTFAVYLVRLIMLLFRNINNPMTTTTAATVFIGKRRRSANLDDDMARILNNIDNLNLP